MQCPKCKIEAAIVKSGYTTVNDDTPDKETELFIKQEYACRNPACDNYKKVIGTVKNPLRLSKDSTET